MSNMDKQHFRILITGRSEDLASRLPSETEKGRLLWRAIPVLEFEAIAVPQMVMTKVMDDPFDWIIFNSPRAVQFWSQSLLEQGASLPPETKIACIGERTALAADRDGFEPDFFPELPGTEGFMSEFEPLLRSTRKKHSILIPNAEAGRKDLRDQLVAMGCEVLTVPIYRTSTSKEIADPPTDHEIKACDLVVFTSPSSVDAFRSHFPLPTSTNIACLGTYTGEHLERQGYKYRILPGSDYKRIEEVL